MLKVKKAIKAVRKTLLTVEVFLRRHQWVVPVVAIIVVIPIAIETYGTVWGPNVVVYQFSGELQGLLDREAQKQGIEGVIRGGIDGVTRGGIDGGIRGGIEGKLQGMIDRQAQKKGIDGVIRGGIDGVIRGGIDGPS
jgi:hypothetical protein